MIDFEWDIPKAQQNVRKHGIRFSEAATVFDDPNALTLEDEDQAEPRFITMGMDALGRLLVVVYTYRKLKIRIISARKATRRESRQYQEAKEI